MAALLSEIGIDYSQIENILSVILVVWGLPSIVLGILEAFFGYKLLKLIRGLFGGFCGGLFGFFAGLIANATHHSSGDFWTSCLICALAFAAVGAIINVLLLYVGVFLESWIISGVIFSILSRSIPAGVIIGLLAAIVCILLFKYSVILFTAIEGGIVAGEALGDLISELETVSNEDLYGLISGQKTSGGILVSIIASVLLIVSGIWIQVRKKKKETASRTESIIVPYARYIVCLVFGAFGGIRGFVFTSGIGRMVSFAAVLIATILLLMGMYSQKKQYLLYGSYLCILAFLLKLPVIGYLSAASGPSAIGIILCFISVILVTLISVLTSLALQDRNFKLRIQANRNLEFIMKYGSLIIVGLLAITEIMQLFSTYGGTVSDSCMIIVLSALLYSVAERSIYYDRYFYEKKRSTVQKEEKRGMPSPNAYDPAVDIVNRVHSDQPESHNHQQYHNTQYRKTAGSDRQHGYGNSADYRADSNVVRSANGQMTLTEAFGSDLAAAAGKVLTEGDHSRIHYLPRENDDGSWDCTCGNNNNSGEQFCRFCGAEHKELKEKLNYQYLHDYVLKEERLEEEQNRRIEEEHRQTELQKKEAADRQRAIKQQEAAERRKKAGQAATKAGAGVKKALHKAGSFIKKHRKIVIPACIAAVCLIAFISYYRSPAAVTNRLIKEAESEEDPGEQLALYRNLYEGRYIVKAHTIHTDAGDIADDTPGTALGWEDSSRGYKVSKEYFSLLVESGDYEDALAVQKQMERLYGDDKDYHDFIANYTQINGSVNFSVASGDYDTPQTVLITRSEDAPAYSRIEYTIDGAEFNFDDLATDDSIPVNLDWDGDYVIEAWLEGIFGGETEKQVETYHIALDIPQNVQSSIESGSYQSPQTITLSTESSDSIIYYTLDGSDPSDQSTQYTGEIQIGSGMTNLKAVCYNSDGLASGISSFMYMIKSAGWNYIYSGQVTEGYSGYDYDYLRDDGGIRAVEKESGAEHALVADASAVYEYNTNLYYIQPDVQDIMVVRDLNADDIYGQVAGIEMESQYAPDTMLGVGHYIYLYSTEDKGLLKIDINDIDGYMNGATASAPAAKRVYSGDIIELGTDGSSLYIVTGFSVIRMNVDSDESQDILSGNITSFATIDGEHLYYVEDGIAKSDGQDIQFAQANMMPDSDGDIAPDSDSSVTLSGSSIKIQLTTSGVYVTQDRTYTVVTRPASIWETSSEEHYLRYLLENPASGNYWVCQRPMYVTDYGLYTGTVKLRTPDQM